MRSASSAYVLVSILGKKNDSKYIIGVDKWIDWGAHFEFVHTHEPVHPHLTHIQYLTIEHPCKHKSIRSLLRSLANDEQTRVIFLRPEGERGVFDSDSL